MFLCFYWVCNIGEMMFEEVIWGEIEVGLNGMVRVRGLEGGGGSGIIVIGGNREGRVCEG